jgi:hypothetical protein
VIAKLKIGDLAALAAAVLLLVASLLGQFGGSGAPNAWSGLALNELVVTDLLGIATAVVAVAAALGRLPERFPWAAWTTATATVVVLSAVFNAVAFSRLFSDLAAALQGGSPGLGVGVYLAIAAAVVLWVSLALRPALPFLARPISSPATTGAVGGGADQLQAWPGAGGPGPSGATFGPGAAGVPGPAGPTPVAGGPYPDVAFGVPSGFGPQPAPAPAPGPAGTGAGAGAAVGAGPAGGPAPMAPAVPQGGPSMPFAPFWAAVPTSRPVYRMDDPSAVAGTLEPGTWYAAVAPHDHGLVVQLPTGQTGVLVEVADLFRG